MSKEGSVFPPAADMRAEALRSLKNTTAQTIMHAIHDAAENGQFRVRFEYGIGSVIVKELQAMGYRVETERGDYQESGWTTISWEE